MQKTSLHKLTETPPLGWNSFDCYGTAANHKLLLENLEVMAEKLKPYGYEYFVLDLGWYGIHEFKDNKDFPEKKHADDVRMDEYGRYLPAESFFPEGLDAIIEKAHQKDLKFGIHIMRGVPRKAVELELPIKGTEYTAADIADTDDTCRWCSYNYGINTDHPAAQAYYDSVVELLASWKVDFIKADDITGHPEEVEALARAVEKADRDIVLSLSPGGDTKMEFMDSYLKCNMLRTTTDIWDNQKSIDKAFDAWSKCSEYNKKHDIPEGFWFDLDMIPFGWLSVWNPPPESNSKQELENINAELSGKGFKRKSLLTKNQKYTFITMRALAASPLFMGGELTSLDQFSYQLITNKEMLRCNQNGVMGYQTYNEVGIEVWYTPSKDYENQGWFGVFNRNNESKNITLSMEELGLTNNDSFLFEDIWKNTVIKVVRDEIEFNIDACGVVFIKFNKKD